jgi:hypothetical protein
VGESKEASKARCTARSLRSAAPCPIDGLLLFFSTRRVDDEEAKIGVARVEDRKREEGSIGSARFGWWLNLEMDTTTRPKVSESLSVVRLSPHAAPIICGKA